MFIYLAYKVGLIIFLLPYIEIRLDLYQYLQLKKSSDYLLPVACSPFPFN
jgi:hypothetical protein